MCVYPPALDAFLAVSMVFSHAQVKTPEVAERFPQAEKSQGNRRRVALLEWR
jgi:hypothetical protein